MDPEAFDPSEFHDRYVEALHELIERKLKHKGTKIKPEKEAPPARGMNVVDLMAALKKSIEKPGATAAKKSAPRAKRAPARKTARPAAKSAPRKRAARG